MLFKITKIEALIFLLLVLIVFLLPYLFTREGHYIAFDNSSSLVGDTIGGITAPFTCILGSILVYLALKAQIEANRLVQEQFKKQEEENVYREKIIMFNDKITILKEEINGFYYSYRKSETFGKVSQKYNYQGSQAIYHLLDQNKHTNHPNKSDTKLEELRHLLVFMNNLLLEVSSELLSNDKSIDLKTKNRLYESIRYYFDSKVNANFQQFRDYISNSTICPDCNMIHGIQNELFDLVDVIDVNLRVNHDDSAF